MKPVWAKLPAGNVTAQEPLPPDNVNQALVYHFGAAKGSPQDVTAYKTEPSEFNAEVNPASLIGAGAKFAGAQTISIPATGAVRLAQGKGLGAQFGFPETIVSGGILLEIVPVDVAVFRRIVDDENGPGRLRHTIFSAVVPCGWPHGHP